MPVEHPERLDHLRRALRLRRHGAALLLTGPAGIGKTHAARELAREVAVRTVEWPAGAPLSALLAALPRGGRASLPAEPTVEAVAAALLASAPLLVLVEDLQAAPERQATLAALAGLAPRLRGVALLATSREAAPEGWPATRVRPLTDEEVEGLFRAQFGQPAPAGLIGWLQARAVGHPLFTLEYLRFLARGGALYNDGQRWHWRPPEAGRLPQGVEALIEHTLLSAGADRPLLEARAALPQADPATWAALADVELPALAVGQLRLQQAGLLQAGAFAHPLYREVLLAGLDPARRRELARRALSVLDDREPGRAAEHLAQHLAHADLPQGEALARLQDAARLAETQGDSGLAGRLLAQATARAGGTLRAELALRAAGHLQHHDLPAARDLALVALREPATAGGAAPIASGLAARLGGVAALDACLAQLPPGAGVDRTLCRMQALQLIGDHPAVLALWEGDPNLRADAGPEVLFPVLLSLLAVGRQPEAEALLPRLEAAPLRDDQRPRLGSLRMLLHFHRGDAAAAAAEAGRLVELLRAGGEVGRLGAVLHNRAVFLQRAGDLPEARAGAREAAELRRRVGDLRGHASSLGLMGELAFDAGELAEAEDALSEALEVLEVLGPSHFQLNILSMLGRLHSVNEGPLSPLLAQRFTRRALEMAEQLGNPRLVVETLPDAALAQLSAGDAAGALARIDEALAREAEVGNDPRLRLQHRLVRGQVLAALDRRPEAQASLQAAAELARAQGDPSSAHWAALELARLAGDPAALRAEAEWFEAAGQGLGALRARRFLAALAPAAPAQPAGGQRLSVLGPCAVDGQPVRGERRQRLLGALLEARLAGLPELSTLDLMEQLYPGQDEVAAGAALKQLVSQVRRQHGPELIRTGARGYLLGSVGSDAEDFLAGGDTRLWPGPGVPELASEEVRAALRQRLLDAAGAQLAADPAEAARAARLLLTDDPYDREALTLALDGLRRAGNHRSLTRLYAQAAAAYAEVGEALPDHWQAYLAGPPAVPGA